jgi:hypothetical protein
MKTLLFNKEKPNNEERKEVIPNKLSGLYRGREKYIRNRKCFMQK